MMDLENIMLSEMSEKDKHCMILNWPKNSFMWNLKNKTS